MVDGTWIKLDRRLLYSAVFCNEKYLKVWIYILLKAKFKPYKTIRNHKTYIEQTGTFLTGRNKMSEELGISQSSLERILTYLESEQQIEQQKTNKDRLIIVKNWKQYQTDGQEVDNRWTTDGQQMDNKRTADGQQMDTIKELEEIKDFKEFQESLEFKKSENLEKKENSPSSTPELNKANRFQATQDELERASKITGFDSAKSILDRFNDGEIKITKHQEIKED